jgi:hypothetical protein
MLLIYLTPKLYTFSFLSCFLRSSIRPNATSELFVHVSSIDHATLPVTTIDPETEISLLRLLALLDLASWFSLVLVHCILS